MNWETFSYTLIICALAFALAFEKAFFSRLKILRLARLKKDPSISKEELEFPMITLLKLLDDTGRNIILVCAVFAFMSFALIQPEIMFGVVLGCICGIKIHRGFLVRDIRKGDIK